jgi:hypothetical protein
MIDYTRAVHIGGPAGGKALQNPNAAAMIGLTWARGPRPCRPYMCNTPPQSERLAIG